MGSRNTNDLFRGTAADSAAPLVANKPYAAGDSFVLSIPATGDFVDSTGETAGNGDAVHAVFRTGGTAPADPLNITPLEFSAMEMVAAPDTGGAPDVTLRSNQGEFPVGDFTAVFYQDNPGGDADGVYYPNIDANANVTLPTVVGNNGRRILIACDWAARAALVTPPTWTTDGAETLELPATGFPAEGSEFVWFIADEANTRWLVRTGGNVELSYVVPAFDTRAEAQAATVPGSLFEGTGAADLADALHRVRRSDSTILEV